MARNNDLGWTIQKCICDKYMFSKHIHKMLPKYIDYFFSSDYTVWISDFDNKNFQIFKNSDYKEEF